jgi:hypothetical protein
MNSEINVTIIEEDEKAFAVFNFEEPVRIEITSDDQTNTKKMFYKILENIVNNEEVKFVFVKEKEDLYSETIEKYINHLNAEIESLKDDYDNPLDN